MFARFIDPLIMPPGSLFLLMLLGLWLLRTQYQRIGRWVFGAGLGLLILLTLPPVPSMLIAFLEDTPALSLTDLQGNKAQAIVVLGGGRYPNAPEYQGQDTVSKHTLRRIRYAAYLHKQTGLPVLVTGGSVYGERKSEAELMAQVLREEFNTPVQWVEGKSINTWENAVYSSEILHQAGMQHIYLVTHAIHMPRSVYSFAQQGLSVSPAPMAFHTSSGDTPFIISIMPSAGNLASTQMALHEIIGYLWYRLKA